MLSNTAKQEILRKLELKLGYPIYEENLTPPTRQAISNLAAVQRHLFVITELLRGENSRIERNAILTAAAKWGRDSEKGEKEALSEQIASLQVEVDKKLEELSKQILSEENARQSGTSPPEYKGKLDVVQLKCSQCGASLPMPTGTLVRCQYCNATFSIQDVSPQIKSMIQSI